MTSQKILQKKYESDIATKGVCALIHGLNQKPEVLEPLIVCLTKAGYRCHLLTLRGHDSAGWEALSVIRAQEWLDQTQTFLQLVEQEARQASLPLHLIAYSLGALVSLNAYRKYEDLNLPDRAVFLAPAFALQRGSRLLKYVLPFVSRVPSFAPQEMRAHRAGLPAKAYKALFDLVDDLQGAWPQSLLCLQSLVLVDPKDELVSAKGIKKLFEEKQWHAVNVKSIGLACAHKQAFHHLISNPSYLSPAEWEQVTGLMLEFLGEGDL